MLPITEIEFLSICASNFAPSINWGGLFRRCEKITTIKACGYGTTTLLQTLTPPDSSCTTSGGKRKKRGDDEDAKVQRTDGTATYVSPVFPKLTTLLLSGLDLSEEVSGCGNLYDVPTDALRRRTLHKVPLKKLSIDSTSSVPIAQVCWRNLSRRSTGATSCTYRYSTVRRLGLGNSILMGEWGEGFRLL